MNDQLSRDILCLIFCSPYSRIDSFCVLYQKQETNLPYISVNPFLTHFLKAEANRTPTGVFARQTIPFLDMEEKRYVH